MPELDAPKLDNGNVAAASGKPAALPCLAV